MISITGDPGADLRFTLDGSQPTSSSTQYTAPFQLQGNQGVVKAIAIQSFGTSTTSVSYIKVDPAATLVPRNGLLLWLMTDVGVEYSGTPATSFSWADLSGAGNNGTQTSATHTLPALISNVLNGHDVISTQTSFLQFPSWVDLPAGFAALNSGVSIFGVTNGGGAIAKLTNGTGANNEVSLSTTNSGGTASATMHVYTSTTDHSLAGSSAVGGNFFVAGGNQTGASTGQVTINGQVVNSGTLSNAVNVSRSFNTVGFSDGSYAEVLIYGRSLSTQEQAAISRYMMQKYGLASSVSAPTFNIPSGTTLSQPTQISMAAQPGAEIRFTTDGTTPSSSTSPIFTAPIDIFFTQTIRAIAVLNGVSSSVSSATYQFDADAFPAPNPSETAAPRINLQVPNPQ